jgi:predicted nucleic acid-binding protein
MISYVDTSAFLAVLDAGDENHQKAREKWKDLIVGKQTGADPILTLYK